MKVLIVRPINDFVKVLVERIFKNESGFEIFQTYDDKEAIELLDKKPDWLITDISVPDYSGEMIILKAVNEKILLPNKIILLCGIDTIDWVHRALGNDITEAIHLIHSLSLNDEIRNIMKPVAV
ncbi:hypothetical protein HOE31_04270 [bacterium]|jgi:DNA-binding NarL/FixJ family response regulator|nr:hypothetical protein [bacterium]MBT4122135.1 hypothetical protein [bacterium]MBT4335493.1 hypothetical protein [bacterium]MBT4495488.1 hypothetical protein [bacterium]MBT4764335.1 hypothetical protein [bacterium]